MTDDALSALFALDRLPGLNQYEDQLARAWLRDWHHFYDSIEFQAHVGGGNDPGPEFADNMRRMYRHNSQRRVDVLARGPFGVTIVEIKHRIDLAQLGQLIAYRWLWVHEHNEPAENVELVALGYFALEDVAHVMRANGVRLILYPENQGEATSEGTS
jgi:hypothetical protein